MNDETPNLNAPTSSSSEDRQTITLAAVLNSISPRLREMLAMASSDGKTLLFRQERDALAWKTALRLEDSPVELANGLWRITR